MPRLIVALAIVPIVALAFGSPPADAQARARLDADALRQIQSLRAEKRTRSPRQLKIGSQLLYEASRRRGAAITRRVRELRTGVEVAGDGSVLVDIDAGVTAAVLDRIDELGGRDLVVLPARASIRARLPLDRLEELADLADVQAIRPAGRAITHKIDTSEGDVAHRADLLRSMHGVDGTGVAIGVLSDGVDSLTTRQNTGDLPPGITVLAGQQGSGDEGTAMLEIVYDLAPGADLFFATAFNGQAAFASNILALRDAGADVIVDDVSYFAESVFQDDDVADAVDMVFADGVLYFSSAGNEGNLNDGTSGVWQGSFNFTTAMFGGDFAHDYDGQGTILNEVTVDSPFAFVLHWSDPNGQSGVDYDLFLIAPNGHVVEAASTDVQDGDDDPFELISSQGFNDTGSYLVIVANDFLERYVHLSAIRGELEFVTEGQVSGHSAAQGAMSIAAVRASTAGGPGGTFDGTESVETYSSDGPRRVFYAADGTQYAPLVLNEFGGQLRDKPDLTAADCVDTSTPGFGTFCGTSASAPHVAAIAALLLNVGAPLGATPADVIAAMKDSALDIEAPGADRDSGAGIVDALAAASALTAAATSVPALAPLAIGMLIGAIAWTGRRRAG